MFIVVISSLTQIFLRMTRSGTFHFYPIEVLTSNPNQL